MTRPAVTMLYRALALWLCLHAPLAAETLHLTRPEAVALARSALLAGNAALADAIARHLVAENPHDVEALLVLAASEEALGRPEEALRLGKRAWAEAEAQGRPDALRYEIARHTAHAALSADRSLVAGYWLRQSIAVAPDQRAAAQSRKDLQDVRAHSPLSFTLSGQIGPTDNVNGGASSGLLTVDNWLIGDLSGWSVQHSGWLAQGQLDAVWNLGVAADGKSRNGLGLSLSATAYALTPSEARANPDLDASDLDVWTLMGSYIHDMALADSSRTARLTLEAGQNWNGGNPFAPIIRAGLDYELPAPAGTHSLLSVLLERQWQDAPSNTVNGASITMSGSEPMQDADAMLGYSLSVIKLRSDWSNTTYNLVEASTSYSPNAKIGPFLTSFALGASYRRYPEFSLGFADVTDGRTDQGFWAQISLSLPESSLPGAPLAGLSPTLSLQQEFTQSNISKYETSGMTVEFGLSKSF